MLFIPNGSEIDRLITGVLKEYRRRLTTDQAETKKKTTFFQPNKRVLQDFFTIALALGLCTIQITTSQNTKKVI